MEFLYGILKVTSMLATGVFGALGLLTKYKDEKGTITKWGRVALGGILLSSGFSLGLYILETSKAKAAAEKAKNEAQATARVLGTILINAQTTADQQKISLQETNKLKVGLEKTLEQQRLNLQRSDYIAKGMESSLTTQQSVLSGNERILSGVTSAVEKQSEVINQTTATLRDTQRLVQPISDIKVTFRLSINDGSPKVSEYFGRLRKEIKQFEQVYSQTGQVNSGLGVTIFSSGEQADKVRKADSIMIEPGSPLAPQFGSKERFLKIIPFYIYFYRSDVTPVMWQQGEGPDPDLMLHVFAADYGNDPKLYTFYDVGLDSFSLVGVNTNATVQKDNRTIAGILDLPGLVMVIEFLNRNDEMLLQSMDLQVALGRSVKVKQGSLKRHIVNGRELYFHRISAEAIQLNR